MWTSSRAPAGAVIASPYHPGTFQSIVIRSGAEVPGRWVEERRHVPTDFRRAFGRPPPERVRGIALFTDNDQTGEPVEAYYGAVRVVPR